MALAFCAGGIGQLILGGLAFAIRNWRHLQLAMSVPMFFFLILTRYEISFLFCYGAQGWQCAWNQDIGNAFVLLWHKDTQLCQIKLRRFN